MHLGGEEVPSGVLGVSVPASERPHSTTHVGGVITARGQPHGGARDTESTPCRVQIAKKSMSVASFSSTYTCVLIKRTNQVDNLDLKEWKPGGTDTITPSTKTAPRGSAEWDQSCQRAAPEYLHVYMFACLLACSIKEHVGFRPNIVTFHPSTQPST